MNRHERRAHRRQEGCWAAYTADPAAEPAHRPAECDGSCGGSVARYTRAAFDAMERHLERTYGPGGPGHDPDRQRDADLWTLALYSRADVADAAGLWLRALGLRVQSGVARWVRSLLAASWARRRPAARPSAALAALVLACPHTGPPARRELMAMTAPGAPVIDP